MEYKQKKRKSMADKYISLYQIERSSVEHFDRLLGDLRRIVFSFNGIVIAGVIAIFGQAIIKSGDAGKGINLTHIKLLFAGSILFAVMNLLFWALEKHYHRYLVVSSHISVQTENMLNLDENKQLTYQLKQVRDNDYADDTIPHCIKRLLAKISKYFRTYDFIYLFPVIVAIGLNFYLSETVRMNDVDPLPIPEFWMASKILLILCLCTIYIIMRRTHWINYHYADAISGKASYEKKLKLVYKMREKRTLFFKIFSRSLICIGTAGIIIAIYSPVFNEYGRFFFTLGVGLFFLISGRGMFLQKNWARKSFNFAVALVMVILIWFRQKQLIDISVGVLILMLFLCSLIIFYLCARKTKLTFMREDGKLNN